MLIVTGMVCAKLRLACTAGAQAKVRYSDGFERLAAWKRTKEGQALPCVTRQGLAGAYQQQQRQRRHPCRHCMAVDHLERVERDVTCEAPAKGREPGFQQCQSNQYRDSCTPTGLPVFCPKCPLDHYVSQGWCHGSNGNTATACTCLPSSTQMLRSLYGQHSDIGTILAFRPVTSASSCRWTTYRKDSEYRCFQVWVHSCQERRMHNVMQPAAEHQCRQLRGLCDVFATE